MEMMASYFPEMPQDDDTLMDEALATLQVDVITKEEAASEPQQSPHGVSELGHIKIERLEMTVSDEASTPTTDAAGRPVSALELKRLRNRECMRRSRTRKLEELTTMKTHIAELEQKLRTLQLRKRQAIETQQLTDHATPTAATQLLVDTLQQENFALRDEIREKEKLREIVAPLLEQEEQRITLDEQQRLYDEEHVDQFAWLRHVAPVLGLKTMTRADVDEIIQQSCKEILANAGHADATVDSPNLVLGWTDKRVVDEQWVFFVFSKDFAHQSIEEVTAKSWETSSNLDKIEAFQPRAQRMVVLHRWDDDTVVIARNMNVPQLCSDGSELERNYCSIFLVFRLRTPTGYVVGTRTLASSEVPNVLLRAGEYRMTYVDLCYGLLFTPLSQDSPSIGCNVRFGGRGGNGTRVYAQICAMDVLLAALRWENHCIAPLNRLAASPLR